MKLFIARIAKRQLTTPDHNWLDSNCLRCATKSEHHVDVDLAKHSYRTSFELHNNVTSTVRISGGLVDLPKRTPPWHHRGMPIRLLVAIHLQLTCVLARLLASERDVASLSLRRTDLSAAVMSHVTVLNSVGMVVSYRFVLGILCMLTVYRHSSTWIYICVLTQDIKVENIGHT